MSTKSDCGLALHKDCLTSIPEELMKEIEETFSEEKHTHPDGHVLFVGESIPNFQLDEWYEKFDKCIQEEHYWLIEACRDYPDNENNVRGEWMAEPFGLGMSVRLCYDRP